MRVPVNSDNDPMVLALTLKAKAPKTTIRFRVADADKPNTSYTDRTYDLTGTKTLYSFLPHTGKLIIADVFTPGTNPIDKNDVVQLVKKEVLPLQTIPQIIPAQSDLVKCGFKFNQYFAENAGWLSSGDSGSVYRSDCGRFRIDYMDVIRDRREKIPLSFMRKLNPGEKDILVPNPKYGAELTTPARISQDRGIKEVSAKYFMSKPVDERMAILQHEDSHFYINNDQHDEKEADKNAINMVLGNGYGFIGTMNGFIHVFENADTPENRARNQRNMNQIMSIEKQYNKYK